MIALRIKAEMEGVDRPFVVRLNCADRAGRMAEDAFLIGSDAASSLFRTRLGPLRLSGIPAGELEGDVILVVPGRRVAHRLIRAGSRHNTLLVTEQCDQLCVMCSQPPKPGHVDHFEFFRTAITLAPENAVIGLSGGEPLLHKRQVFGLVEQMSSGRPDASFHILTNGQHFGAEDRGFLVGRRPGKLLWGIPLYAAQPSLHDAIVGKLGAFERLILSMSILAKSGAAIELRTVVTKENAAGLGELARFIAAHLPFIQVWAIMQLENIGYGRQNWNRLFFDNSEDFGPVGLALDVATARGISARLYNFPLCTVPVPYRRHALATISDWKQRYLGSCDGCAVKGDCGGFFSWYPEDRGFGKLGLA